MSSTKKKWVEGASPDMVKLFRDIAQDPNGVPWMVEFAKQTLESDFLEDPNYHIRASPLFELSSIKICRDLFRKLDKMEDIDDEDSVIEVYGHIRLIDDKENMFTLFNLDRQDAKTVILQEKSSVILQKPQLGTPRCLPENLKLHILLKFEMSFSLTIGRISLSLHYDVQGVGSGFSRFESTLGMSYTIFQCAVLAFVSITVLSVGDLSSNAVTGKICASMKLRNEVVTHELFDKPSKLDIGASNELCVLAVPVYSSLDIILTNLKFDDEKPVVSDSKLEFHPRDSNYESRDQEIVGQHCCILVSVTWEHPFHKLPENYLCDWNDAPSSSDSEGEYHGRNNSFEKSPHKRKGKRSSRFEKQKWPEHMKQETSDRIGYYIQPELQTLCQRKWIISCSPDEHVEVFCVSICSFDAADGASSISGTIIFYQSGKVLDYFSRNEMKVGILYPHVTKGFFTGPNFGMGFELEDAKGQEISVGFLEYDELRAGGWYNRRICSVIPGKHGFAAAYYTIFHDAIQAKVKITLMPEHGAEVYLFEKGKLELVKGGNEVPLTKSLICVPSNASLVVTIGFRVLVDGNCVETLRGKATFKPRRENEDPNDLKIITGLEPSATYHLVVSVVWGYNEFVPNHLLV